MFAAIWEFFVNDILAWEDEVQIPHMDVLVQHKWARVDLIFLHVSLAI